MRLRTHVFFCYDEAVETDDEFIGLFIEKVQKHTQSDCKSSNMHDAFLLLQRILFSFAGTGKITHSSVYSGTTITLVTFDGSELNDQLQQLISELEIHKCAKRIGSTLIMDDEIELVHLLDNTRT